MALNEEMNECVSVSLQEGLITGSYAVTQRSWFCPHCDTTTAHTAHSVSTLMFEYIVKYVRLLVIKFIIQMFLFSCIHVFVLLYVMLSICIT